MDFSQAIRLFGRCPGAIQTGGNDSVLNRKHLADRAIGNLQQWLIGTHHGVSRAQLPVYLDEFVFRHNRRKQPMAAFQTLLGLGTVRSQRLTRRYAAPPIFPKSKRNLLGFS